MTLPEVMSAPEERITHPSASGPGTSNTPAEGPEMTLLLNDPHVTAARWGLAVQSKLGSNAFAVSMPRKSFAVTASLFSEKMNPLPYDSQGTSMNRQPETAMLLPITRACVPVTVAPVSVHEVT